MWCLIFNVALDLHITFLPRVYRYYLICFPTSMKDKQGQVVSSAFPKMDDQSGERVKSQCAAELTQQSDWNSCQLVPSLGSFHRFGKHEFVSGSSRGWQSEGGKILEKQYSFLISLFSFLTSLSGVSALGNIREQQQNLQQDFSFCSKMAINV